MLPIGEVSYAGLRWDISEYLGRGVLDAPYLDQFDGVWRVVVRAETKMRILVHRQQREYRVTGSCTGRL